MKKLVKKNGDGEIVDEKTVSGQEASQKEVKEVDQNKIIIKDLVVKKKTRKRRMVKDKVCLVALMV